MLDTLISALTAIIMAPLVLFPAATGTALPSGTAIFETSLAAPITSSATSLTLTSNSIRGGSTLAGYECFTIDEGSAQAEFVCGTVSGTTVSSLTRGIDPSTGTSTVAALQFAHRRGANVKITDFPLIQVMRNQNNGIETFPNVLRYDSGFATTSFTDRSHIISKGYADDLALSAGGIITANESSKGIAELATQAEMASASETGGSGPLVLQSKYSSSTAPASGNYVPVTNSSGILDDSFLTLAMPPGAVIPYATGTAPSGWLVADGSSYAVATYPDLFAVIGYSYGGSGANFNVPDLSGRNVVGFGSATTTFDEMGETGGGDQHLLTTSEMPSHTHDVKIGNDSGGITTTGQNTDNDGVETITSESTGGNTPHNIMDPFIVLLYIIKT